MNRTKIMFKVNLLNDTGVEFTLTDVIDPNTMELHGSHFFKTSNKWTLYFGNNFHISKKNVICLPKECKRQKSKIYFNSNQERYEFMKNLVYALEDWANSHLFETKSYQKTVKYYKSIWILL